MRAILLFILTLLLFGCTNNGPTRQSDILSDNIIKTVSERLNKKYGLKLIAIGGGEDKDGVWLLSAMYQRIDSKMTEIEEARKIILDCTEEFLNAANHDAEFRPYMQIYPFTPKNLEISILNYDENHREVHFPFISAFSINYGFISYKSLGPELKLPYAQKVTETYEEALERSRESSLKISQ